MARNLKAIPGLARKTNPTNVDLVKAVMDFSQYGALAQAFIIQAVRDYAEKVAAPETVVPDNAFMTGATWKGVAVEVKEKFDNFYG